MTDGRRRNVCQAPFLFATRGEGARPRAGPCRRRCGCSARAGDDRVEYPGYPDALYDDAPRMRRRSARRPATASGCTRSDVVPPFSTATARPNRTVSDTPGPARLEVICRRGPRPRCDRRLRPSDRDDAQRARRRWHRRPAAPPSASIRDPVHVVPPDREVASARAASIGELAGRPANDGLHEQQLPKPLGASGLQPMTRKAPSRSSRPVKTLSGADRESPPSAPRVRTRSSPPRVLLAHDDVLVGVGTPITRAPSATPWGRPMKWTSEAQIPQPSTSAGSVPGPVGDRRSLRPQRPVVQDLLLARLAAALRPRTRVPDRTLATC